VSAELMEPEPPQEVRNSSQRSFNQRPAAAGWVVSVGGPHHIQTVPTGRVSSILSALRKSGAEPLGARVGPPPSTIPQKSGPRTRQNVARWSDRVGMKWRAASVEIDPGPFLACYNQATQEGRLYLKNGAQHGFS
jgi:hypothetical protein